MANHLITGGTGLIGRALVSSLIDAGHEVTVLTRSVRAAKKIIPEKVIFIESLKTLNSLDGFDAVINLAGEPIVNKRWSEQQKRIIEKSRWDVTQTLVNLLNNGKHPPKTFISGSAIGFYGRQSDHKVAEGFQLIHKEYSHSLCEKWENIASTVADKTRVCILRTGVVLSESGGALDKMKLPFKLGLGGPIGDGSHYMSWIHITDMVNGIMFLLENTETQGVYNFTAPNPVTNKAFSQAFASALGRPCLLFTPQFALKLAMGEMADLLIYGQNAIPQRLLNEGFSFTYPKIDDALASLKL